MHNLFANKFHNLLEESYQSNYPNSNQHPWSKNLEKTKLAITYVYEAIKIAFDFISVDQKNQLFNNNKNILQEKFSEIRADNKVSDQKIAAYFVSSHDHNGFLLGTAATLNHFQEIKNLQTHGYTVYPHVVDNFFQIYYRLPEAVNLVYITAHGDPDSLDIEYFHIYSNLTLPNLGKEADIVLYSCSTGVGLESSIASKMAKDNPGANVFGALQQVWAISSNIHFSAKGNESFIEGVEYQPSMLNLPLPFEDYMHKFNFIVDATSNSDANTQNETNLAGNITCEALAA